MSPTTSAANGGGITSELRNWARGCHSTEAAVELLIRARGGRFLERRVSHGCGPTTEESPLRHAGCGSGSTRNSSEDSAGECL
jgi:hypothetical protein